MVNHLSSSAAAAAAMAPSALAASKSAKGGGVSGGVVSGGGTSGGGGGAVGSISTSLKPEVCLTGVAYWLASEYACSESLTLALRNMRSRGE